MSEKTRPDPDPTPSDPAATPPDVAATNADGYDPDALTGALNEGTDDPDQAAGDPVDGDVDVEDLLGVEEGDGE